MSTGVNFPGIFQINNNFVNQNAPIEQHLLTLMNNRPEGLRIQAIEQLETIARNEPQHVERIVQALKAIIQDEDSSFNLIKRCITSFNNLKDSIGEAQIEDIFKLTMNLLGDEDLDIQNTSMTFTNLLKKNVNGLIPIVLDELTEIVDQDLREKKDILCAHQILKVVSIILSDPHLHLTNEVKNQTALCFQNTWESESGRHAFGQIALPEPIIYNKILGKALLTMARFAQQTYPDFTKFLVREAINTGDYDDLQSTRISPFVQAAIKATVVTSSDKRVRQLINCITEGPPFVYNKIWAVGELAFHVPTLFPQNQIQRLMQVTITILTTSLDWRFASQAAMALGKMRSIFTQPQKLEAIQALNSGLIGEHNIIEVSPVQINSAKALSMIGFTASREIVSDILTILINRQNEPDHEVSSAVIKALKNLMNFIFIDEFPRIIDVLLIFMNDRNSNTSVKAAKALKTPINRCPVHVQNRFELIENTAIQAIERFRRTNQETKDKVYGAIVYMLGDVAKQIVAIDHLQRLRTVVSNLDPHDDAYYTLTDAVESTLEIIDNKLEQAAL